MIISGILMIDSEWEDLGEQFGLEVVDSDSGYSHISTKRKSSTESETCTKRK